MKTSISPVEYVTLTFGENGQFEVAMTRSQSIRSGRSEIGKRKVTHVVRRSHGKPMGPALRRLYLSYGQAGTFMTLFELAKKRADKEGVKVSLRLTPCRWGYQEGERDAYIVVEAGLCSEQRVPEQKARLYNLEIAVSWQTHYYLTYNGYSDVKELPSDARWSEAFGPYKGDPLLHEMVGFDLDAASV